MIFQTSRGSAASARLQERMVQGDTSTIAGQHDFVPVPVFATVYQNLFSPQRNLPKNPEHCMQAPLC
jgi:hypothetical protein